jgi:hypothetical protein
VRPYLENTHHKKGLAEWLKWEEYLPSKQKALSINPSTAKKKKKKILHQ